MVNFSQCKWQVTFKALQLGHWFVFVSKATIVLHQKNCNIFYTQHTVGDAVNNKINHSAETP